MIQEIIVFLSIIILGFLIAYGVCKIIEMELIK